MARNRRAGETPLVPTRGPTETPLATLLRARRFRIAAGGEQVGARLVQHGAQLSADAVAWIGSAPPPRDAPTLALAEHAGTLGPRSWGFLNNTQPALGPVAALDLPALEAMPRSGRLGVVVAQRGTLPDLVPLFCARDLGVAWIISVGDGDPAEVLSFLAEDPATDAIAIALGSGARPAGLRPMLGAKPTVVLGGDPLCRAVARRAGAHVVDRIGEWLALAALLGAGATLADPVEIWVRGGGLDWVRGELERYRVTAPLRVLDESDADALVAAVAAAVGPRVVVLVGPGSWALPPPAAANVVDAVRFVTADTRQPEQVSRLFKALGRELEREQDTDAGAADGDAAPHDASLAARVRAEVEGTLSDHDAKRLLKAWGIKVTRQAPTGTPTGAIKLAKAIGLPVVVAHDDDERIADTLPEVRRVAALLLEAQDPRGAAPPSVMVRERFPESPRCRIRVVQERAIGAAMRIGDAIGLLPLDGAEAQHLARQAGARRAADQRLLARVLTQIGAMALAEGALVELDLFLGAEPTVLRAQGTLKKT
ncbi:MAG TPA: hypothetical protein VM261_28285 [Kofleriaceae bacterium]|nr:hypothetical protein [Kofleriaceae bacterium]